MSAPLADRALCLVLPLDPRPYKPHLTSLSKRLRLKPGLCLSFNIIRRSISNPKNPEVNVFSCYTGKWTLERWVFIPKRKILSGFRTQATDSKTSALIWHVILLPRLPTLEFSSHPHFSWWCLSPNGVSLRLRSELHQWALPTALTYVINRLSQKWWCIISEARLDRSHEHKAKLVKIGRRKSKLIRFSLT